MGRGHRSPPRSELLDYLGILGARHLGAHCLAAEKRQTLVTFIFFAAVTGVGGGTIRDLLIRAPVFWVHTNWDPAAVHFRSPERVADIA